ncbi:hypothetical protein KVR01_009445 [Diaporthe batatas]|uniref:uncharacterized protein n=1 Tax=Diaporthe batatas TaxID=748121 RepID=UPI001D0466A7|nr:uncharacterized protein KVR01_009445 [Diaporthe batatas]KAG8161181.1 hypothetical protein KVR01_009445 [Diaporthe batatas]
MTERATIRMRPLVARNQPPDWDEVYYIRASIPAIHDIAISGPFHVLEATLPNLRLRIAESSEAYELFQAGTEKGQLLNQFSHVRGPVDRLPGHFIEVELQRVHDAPLKRALPCPVYRVSKAEPLLHEAGRPPESPRPGGGMCVEDLQVVGSYVSAADARARANEVLDEWLSAHPGVLAFPKHIGSVKEGGSVMGAVIVFIENSSPKIVLSVVVTFDSGSTT